MNRSLLALLAIVAVGAGVYYYTQIKKPAAGTPETAVATVPAADESEPLLFTWENWADPPFVAEYKAKYGVEPRTAIWADEDRLCTIAQRISADRFPAGEIHPRAC